MSIVTTNMGLTIPTPSITPGPTYANEINGTIQLIADHDHSNSAKITPAGLSITSDLTVNSNNLTALRTSRYTSQSSTLSGVNDVNCAYFYNGNYYINNGSGVPVQITAGASVNGGGGGTSNAWESITVAANRTIIPSDTFVNINVTTSSPITISLPVASAVAAGRYYIICDNSGGSVTNNITLAPNGANAINGSSSSRTLASAFGTWIVRSNGTSWQLMYLAFSGLTSSALTYGSAVLSSTGLTVGSTTLTSSALSTGTVTASGAVSAPSLSTTGAISAGTTIFATGNIQSNATISANAMVTTNNITVGGNAAVTGTLGVTGTSTVGNISMSGTLSGGTVTSNIVSNSVTATTLTVSSSGGTLALPSGSTVTRNGTAAKFIISSAYTRLATSYLGTASYADIPGYSVSLTCVAGDVLIIDSSYVTSNTSSVFVKMMINDGGTSIDPLVIRLINNTSAINHAGAHFTYTVVTGGTVTVRGQGKGTTLTFAGDDFDGSSGQEGASSLRVVQYR